MREIPLLSNNVVIALVTLHDATGAAVNPDSTLTVADVTLVDTLDGGAIVENDMGVAVSNPSTGVIIIKASYEDILTSENYHKSLWGWLTAVIGGVTVKVPIPPFRFVPPHNAGKVATDAGNSTTTFKVTKVSDASATPLLETDDDAVETLIVFYGAAGVVDGWGQVRKVTAYDDATGFVTVSPALSAVPADGQCFLLINC